MKIPNKRELQQIAFNHSSDIYFEDLSFYKKYCKTILFLMNNTTCASDNPSHFRNNLLDKT